MKTLLVQEDKLQEWDVDAIINTRFPSLKDQAERIQLHNYQEKQDISEFYKTSYLELEYQKRV